MNGIQYMLRELHLGEKVIATDLLQLAERHVAEHEVHHVAKDLARWSQQHVRLLADHAPHFELHLDYEGGQVANAPRHAVSAAEAAGAAGLLLLEELRHVYLRASENSVDWEMLAQVAQAKKVAELVELSQRCHPQTLRQIRWANTMIKTLSPQILSSL